MFSVLVNVFESLKRNYNITICIKDFTGFIPINKKLDAAMTPYMNHVNPYCSYVKSEKNQYKECLTMIPKMKIKCMKFKHTFFGVCHGGVGEYVTPIFSGDVCIGAITYNAFKVKPEIINRRIDRLIKKSENLELEIAKNLYYNYIIQIEHDIVKNIITTIELAASYLGMTYNKLSTLEENPNNTPVINPLVSNILEYIQNNYAEKITLETMSILTHYSETYISRVFKKEMGIGIATYINKFRIEISKKMLLTTALPLSDISELVGFEDSNYYSKVFSSLVAITPGEFRRRYR